MTTAPPRVCRTGCGDEQRPRLRATVLPIPRRTAGQVPAAPLTRPQAPAAPVPSAARFRVRCRTGLSAPGGQSTVEIAILLPAIFILLFLFVQLFLCWRAQTMLDRIADAASAAAGAAGGETPAVDAQILSLLDQHTVPRASVHVQVSTDTGSGQLHRADQAQAVDAPPAASYHGDVTVALSYQYPLLIPFLAQTWTIPASASRPATVLGGLAP